MAEQEGKGGETRSDGIESKRHRIAPNEERGRVESSCFEQKQPPDAARLLNFCPLKREAAGKSCALFAVSFATLFGSISLCDAEIRITNQAAELLRDGLNVRDKRTSAQLVTRPNK